MRNIVRELRKKRGLSQAELGEILGVARQSVNAIENGKHHPSLPLAFDIAKLFDLRVDRVFFQDEDVS